MSHTAGLELLVNIYIHAYTMYDRFLAAKGIMIDLDTNLCVFRRKYTARLQEQEEHIETLIVKVNNLEKQKSRLQSEVEVLIIDLEKV